MMKEVHELEIYAPIKGYVWYYADEYFNRKDDKA